jgi:hypothetical protein
VNNVKNKEIALFQINEEKTNKGDTTTGYIKTVNKNRTTIALTYKIKKTEKKKPKSKNKKKTENKKKSAIEKKTISIGFLDEKI